MLQVDYTATATNKDLLTPQQTILEKLAVHSAQWDPLVAPLPAGIAGGADLVVCNHAWGSLSTDPRLLMKNLASGARQRGFVLFHTLLKGETIGETVSFLSSTEKGRNQQGLLTQVRINFTFPEVKFLLTCSLSLSLKVLRLTNTGRQLQ